MLRLARLCPYFRKNTRNLAASVGLPKHFVWPPNSQRQFVVVVVVAAVVVVGLADFRFRLRRLW